MEDYWTNFLDYDILVKDNPEGFFIQNSSISYE